MKKALVLIICLGLFGMSACSKDTTITKSSDDNVNYLDTTPTDTSDENVVNVDEGLLTVTLTIPANLMGETTQADIDKAVSEKGFISGILNDDGSATYVMTKAKHKEIIDEMAESMDKSIQDIVDSNDYPNIVSVTHNKDFTDFEIKYAADEVDLVDSFMVYTFYLIGWTYGAYSGQSAENIHVEYVSSDTGDIISEANSRDIETSENTKSVEETVNDRLIGISNDVTELWNEVIIEANSYANSGTSCTGEALDIDFVIENMDKYYGKVTEDKEYINNLGDEYSDIISAFEKLYDKATIICNNLRDETPKANVPLSYANEIELFQQYSDYFRDTVYELAYGD